MTDDVNWEYYQGIKFATEAAAARCAELEAALAREQAETMAMARSILDLEAELKLEEDSRSAWMRRGLELEAEVARLTPAPVVVTPDDEEADASAHEDVHQDGPKSRSIK